MDYYYIENNQQSGPLPAEQLVSKITPDTNVWCAGMSGWLPASQVPELQALFQNVASVAVDHVANGGQVVANPTGPAPDQYMGEELVDPETGNIIKTHKTKALVTLIVSVLLCGIVAIVLSSVALSRVKDVKQNFADGRMRSAASDSKTVNDLCNWAIALLCFGVVYRTIKICSYLF